jgi:hypothetical protein
MLYKAKGAVSSDSHTKHINVAWALPRIFECYSWWYVKLPLGFKRLMATPIHFWHPVQTKKLMSATSDGRGTENGSRESVVGIAIRYGLDGPGFESRQGQAIFCSRKPFRPALGLKQPSVQWVPGTFTAVKRPGRVVHSPPSNAEIKNEWSYTSVLVLRLHGVDRDNWNGKWN